MTNISNKIKQLMDDKGITQTELSQLTGITQSSISDYINGRYNPKQDKIDLISKALGVSPSIFFNSISPNNNYKLIPMLGTIAAGVPLLAQENIEDYFNIDNRLKCDFALRIQGDSMIGAGIFNNDIVFIKKQSDLNNGDIGAVLLDDSATLKRFFRDNGTIILQAENDNYKPKIYTDGNLLILGKLVAVLNIRD